MVANSNHFYFDYKNGKYGFNTNPNRGADTFVPFKKGKLLFELQMVLINATMATQKWGYVDVSAYDKVKIYYGCSTDYNVNLYVYNPSETMIANMTGDTSIELTVSDYDTIYFSQSGGGAWFTLKVEDIE